MLANQRPDTHFESIVIGKGLIGAAAGRYLSQLSPHVAIIGPDEPAAIGRPNAIFASHYDEGRLTHRLSRDLIWAWLGDRAIRQYPILEAQSGITFHRACGSLIVGRNMSDFRAEVVKELAIETRFYPGRDTFQPAYPMFEFPAGYQALFESPPAGYINPRSLIRAQLAIAAQQGAVIIPEIVVRVSQQANGLTVITDSGRNITANNVLIARGVQQ